MRSVAAYAVSARLAESGSSLQRAVERTVDDVGSVAGVVAVTPDGDWTMSTNAPVFMRGVAAATGEPQAAVLAKERLSPREIAA